MKRVVDLFFLFLTAFALPSFGGGNVVRDLGEGLVYWRATAESDSGDSGFVLPVVGSNDEAGRDALILDLRYAVGGAGESQRLVDWLNALAAVSPTTGPVYFLVNVKTSAALCAAVAEFAQNYPALLIGPVGDGGDSVASDIMLSIDAEEERAAYAALASAEADIGELTGEGAAIDKRRYDEAAVIAAHAAPERVRGSGRRESTEPPPEVTVARPVDLALQRAIHLHRAWRVFEQHP